MESLKRLKSELYKKEEFIIIQNKEIEELKPDADYMKKYLRAKT